MSWYDSIPFSGIFGGNPVQNTSSVQGIGAGQNTDSNGGTNLSALNLPYFQQDRNQIQSQLAGQSPFASQNWNGLINQLQTRANGQNSLAQQNYNMANQSTINSIGSLARGTGSPGAAQSAMQQQANVGQGQAAGLALAGTQEQQADQQALSSALSNRDQLNQNAYTNLLNQQMGLSVNQGNMLRGDQSFTQSQNQINQQNQANQYGALASILGSAARMGGSPGGG